MRRQRMLATGCLILSAVLLPQLATAACPICFGPPQRTISDDLAESDIVVITKYRGIAQGTAPAACQGAFEITQILKSPAGAVQLGSLVTSLHDPNDPGGDFLLVGTVAPVGGETELASTPPYEPSPTPVPDPTDHAPPELAHSGGGTPIIVSQQIQYYDIHPAWIIVLAGIAALVLLAAIIALGLTWFTLRGSRRQAN